MAADRALNTSSGKDDQLLIQLTWVAPDDSRSVAATLLVAADMVCHLVRGSCSGCHPYLYVAKCGCHLSLAADKVLTW
jgi:hypothetical protein